MASSFNNPDPHIPAELRSLTLARENDHLRHILSHYINQSPFTNRLKNSIKYELFGDLRLRPRFIKRVIRQVFYRITGLRLFSNLGPIQIPLADQPNIDHLLRPLYLKNAQLAAVADSDNRRLREKAEKTWHRFMMRQSSASYLQSLRPHDGQPGRLRVFVMTGGGGIGDVLLYSPLIAALKRKLNPCEIVVFNPQPIAHEVLDGNPDVSCVLTGDWLAMLEAIQAAQNLDIFDVIVYSACFIPQIMLGYRSRLPQETHRYWISGNNESFAVLSHLISNTGIGLLDRIVNLHYFDLLGTVTGLPIDAKSNLCFTPDPQAINAVELMDLPRPFVTVRDGANEGDSKFAQNLGAQRTTKQLSAGKWEEIVLELHKAGFYIVQVGGPSDMPIRGVNLDLRAQTTLSELCFVMKNAITHIDTEGGLAHFARAVNRRSIIVFGPTSASFFGYPGNINIQSDACSPCWYTNDTWVAHCARGTESPLCTATVSAAAIAGMARNELKIQQATSFRMTASSRYDRNWQATYAPLNSLEDWRQFFVLENLRLLGRGLKNLKVLLLMPPHSCIIRALVSEGAAVEVVAAPINPDTRYLQPDFTNPPPAVENYPPFTVASPFNLPFDTGSFDAVIAFELLSATDHKTAMLQEWLRLVTPDGLICTTFLFTDKMDRYRQEHKATAFKALDHQSIQKLFQFAQTDPGTTQTILTALTEQGDPISNDIPPHLTMGGLCLQPRQRD